MNKRIIVFLLLIFTIQSKAFFNNEVVLPKYYKKLSTFSGDISEKKSFHLIFTKNKKTKNYKAFSYVFDGDKVTELPGFTNDKPYNILSYHNKNNVLTLLLSHTVRKKSFLIKVDYDLVTKKITKSNAVNHLKFEKVLREKERSVLIYKKDNFLTIKLFSGNNQVVVKQLKINKLDKINDYFRDDFIGAVKTDEFIKNGSATRFKLYLDKNELIFTKDTKLFSNTEVIRLNFNNDKILVNQSSYDNNLDEETIDMGSFYSNQKVYQVIIRKEKSFISIFNSETNKKLKTIVLDESLNSYIKNNKFQGILKFLKSSKKPEHIITIAVNNTRNNKIRIRLDYVDINYRYNNNFWFQQQMMREMNRNLMQINLPKGFGPKPLDDTSLFFSISKEKRFFELLIDENCQLLNEDLPSSIYKEVNKTKYWNNLNSSAGTFDSSCFLLNNFRYFFYNKHSKKFIFKSKNL